MIDRIILFSIKNKLIISILVLAMALWGVHSLRHLPLDAVPDITDNQVQVITNAADLSAQEVERLITYPLELSMANIPRVENIRSISRFGLSVITIVFEPEADIYWAREQINQKIQSVRSQIPDGLGSPEMGPISTGLGEIYQYTIRADSAYQQQYSPIELRSIQDWIVKRQLSGIPGVVEVNSSGGYLKQYEIAIKQQQLKAYHLSLSDVYEAVEANNENVGGSYIEKGDQTYFIRAEGIATSIADLEKIVVSHRNHLPILLKDVATVQIGHAPRFGAMTMDGLGEVVGGQVMMLKGANSMEVTNRVIEKIESIKPSLPEGIILEPYLDRSKLIDRTTHTIAKNLIEGALIVIFILVLLLGNVRAGLIVASVIPLSLLFAVSMMSLFGVSANLMSLGALDFGLVVDGAVIIVEAILHRLGLKNRDSQLSAAEQEAEIYTAATRIRKSAAFGEIIILIVYLPILFLQGVEGKMFIPMAQTVSFAIFGALLLSLTYVPMMSAAFLKNSRENEDSIANKIIRGLYRLYRPLLDVALRMQYAVIIIAATLLTMSLFTLSRMGGEFIPTLEEGDFALHQILPPGSSIQKGVEVSAHLQNILLEKFPEVEKVVTKIGTAEIPTDIMPLEAGDIYVIMKPKSEWTTALTRDEMFEKMEEELNKFPGVMYEFTQPIQMRFNELMTGVRQDIAIKIYGEDLGLLVKKAGEAETILSTLAGIGDVKVEATAGLQQMVIQYDRAKIAAYGLSISAVNDVIKTAFAGKHVGQYYEGERNYDIVVRLDESERQGLESLRKLYVNLPNGGYAPLIEFAKVDFEEGPTQISRDNTQRRITIGVNARNTDIATLVNDIKSAFSEKLELPAGYFVTYGGQFENLERAQNTLLLVVPIALTLIFVLLYLTFRSVGESILIFTAIPLSAIGGIWALYLRGIPFSISAGVGFIALFGVAVLNGIVLIAYFNQLRKEGMTDTKAIIYKGTEVRLRPVVMTALVASLGFLPMAISTTAGAEVQRPLATVVIGGLITATFLTLIVLPILYRVFIERGWIRYSPILLILAMSQMGNAQSLSLTEAITRATEQSNIDQNLALRQEAVQLQKDHAVMPQPLNLALNSEEFDFKEAQGIHSIIVSKNFNTPKQKIAQEELLDIQDQSLRIDADRMRLLVSSQVMQEYIQISYQQSLLQLYADMTEQYESLLSKNRKRLEYGEINQLPILQNELLIQKVTTQRQEAEISYESALDGFQRWYMTRSIVIPRDLESISDEIRSIDTDLISNSYELSASQLSAQQSALAANNSTQWNGGLRLQTVSGGFPFFGFSVGVNLPLNKSYQQSREAAVIKNQNALESEKDRKLRMYQAKVSQLQTYITNQEQNLAKYKAQNISISDDIINSTIRAFEAGEASFAEVQLAYDSYYDIQRSYLDQLLSLWLKKAELSFLILEY